jgi:hypothetical protein
LIDVIPDSSAPVQSVKSDLQAVLSRVPDLGDPTIIATKIIQGFTNHIRDRYIADIIDGISNSKLRAYLSTLLKQSGNDIQRFKEAIETWFNDAMDRVSGWVLCFGSICLTDLFRFALPEICRRNRLSPLRRVLQRRKHDQAARLQDSDPSFNETRESSSDVCVQRQGYF